MLNFSIYCGCVKEYWKYIKEICCRSRSISNQDNNTINSQGSSNKNQVDNKCNFPLVGLNNIGSTCYMNATLQCLLHVNDLYKYFLKRYPNDKNKLDTINRSVPSRGKISNAFYELVREVSDKNKKTYSPNNFKTIIGQCNGQFARFEANDSKDLILYLLQTMHEELNYYGDKKFNNVTQPDQYDRMDTFRYFRDSYGTTNYSLISNIFYGTYEFRTLCHKCRRVMYSYQKFEFISFEMSNYHNREFNIYDGFRDITGPERLFGTNQYYCSTCNQFVDSEITTNIIQLPNKLLINIDYGVDKVFKPSKVKFDEEIDITQYVVSNFGAPIKYRLIGVCTHLGQSGWSGHYIAFCKNKETGQWYKFNDSHVSSCDKKDIYSGSPYLLIYEVVEQQ